MKAEAFGVAMGGSGVRAAAWARFGTVAALSLALAHCGQSRVDPKYGVAASPRLVDAGQPVPKGGGRNHIGRPYVVAGRTYVPEENVRYRAEGLASWYGRDFHGRKTANGEIYDMNSVSAAHPTLPLPSYVRITNLRNGRSVIVRVNDRGPFHRGRVIDVSVRAAELLDFRRSGTARVRVEYVGRAALRGSDDNKLAATLRHHGTPAPGPTMLAAAAPQPARHVAVAAPPRAPEPATMRPTLASSDWRPAPAPQRTASASVPASFESRFAPAAAAPVAATAPGTVSAYAPGFYNRALMTGRGLY